jgi:hypothetical protein
MAVIALAVASCSAGDVELSTTVAASTIISATTTMTVASTTVATTRAPRRDPVWLATYRRDFPGYAVELIEIHTDDRIVIPANRFDPFPGTIFGDGHGGLVIGRPIARLPAGALHPEELVGAGTWINTVAIIGGVPNVLYRVSEGESGWDGLIMWDDVTISLIAQPLDGEPTTVLSAHSASRIDYGSFEGDVGEPRPGGSAYGGGVLAVVWTTRTEECRWLELRDGLSAEPAPVVNPWPATNCENGAAGEGVLDVAVTADGEILIAQVYPPDSGPDLVAWDLATGREIDRLTGVLQFEHDGYRRFAVERRTSGTEHQTAVVELTQDGFSVTPLPDIATPIGIITGELRIDPKATLTPAEPWTTCSTAGRKIPAAQDELPAPVAATRNAIAAAVIECDLAALAELALVSPEFRMVDAFSYCDEPWPMSLQDDDVVHYWYAGDRAVDELTTLLETLESPYRTEADSYVWVGEYDYRIEIDQGGAWVRNQRGFPPQECEGMDCTC